MHVQSRDGAHDQVNAPVPPDPFPSLRVGSGNDTVDQQNLMPSHDLVATVVPIV